MKKFIFSAVALIAFSFAGMANTGGEENMEIQFNDTKEIDIDCNDFIYDGLQMLDPNNEFEPEQMVAVANTLNLICYYFNRF